jgi:hypothetical protein
MARLDERLRRLEAAYPAEWCSHRPPLVLWPNGAWEKRDFTHGFSTRCPCGRPPLTIAVEYTDAL